MSNLSVMNPYAASTGSFPGMQSMPISMPYMGMTGFSNISSPYGGQSAFGLQNTPSAYPNLPIAAMGQVSPMQPIAPTTSQPPSFFSQMAGRVGNFMNQGFNYVQNHPMVSTGAAMGLAGGMMGCPYATGMGLGAVATGLAQSQWNPKNSR